VRKVCLSSTRDGPCPPRSRTDADPHGSGVQAMAWPVTCSSNSVLQMINARMDWPIGRVDDGRPSTGG
jgi:hypothetical protein